jgi:hypothetical protein
MKFSNNLEINNTVKSVIDKLGDENLKNDDNQIKEIMKLFFDNLYHLTDFNKYIVLRKIVEKNRYHFLEQTLNKLQDINPAYIGIGLNLAVVQGHIETVTIFKSHSIWNKIHELHKSTAIMEAKKHDDTQISEILIENNLMFRQNYLNKKKDFILGKQ